MGKQYEIPTGDFVGIDAATRVPGLKILYSGMPNSETFALTALVLRESHSPISAMFYYPYAIGVDKGKINVFGEKFSVLNVDVNRILLEYLEITDPQL